MGDVSTSLCIALIKVAVLRREINMLQLPCHKDVKDCCCDNQDALHYGWSGRDNAVAYVQTEQAQKTQLAKVDTNHELLKGPCVKATFGVDVGVESVKHVVAVRQIDKSNANSREAQYQRSYHCVRQGNHPHGLEKKQISVYAAALGFMIKAGASTSIPRSWLSARVAYDVYSYVPLFQENSKVVNKNNRFAIRWPGIEEATDPTRDAPYYAVKDLLERFRPQLGTQVDELKALLH